MNIQAKDLIAMLVLVLAFGLLAPYVVRGQVPPDVIMLISSSAIAGVLAYYFGAHNGNITGLAASAMQVSNMASQLASQAIEKRATPPPAATTTVLPVAVAVPPASSATTGPPVATG